MENEDIDNLDGLTVTQGPPLFSDELPDLPEPWLSFEPPEGTSPDSELSEWYRELADKAMEAMNDPLDLDNERMDEESEAQLALDGVRVITGKTAGAIGVNGTTEIHIKEVPGGRYEARCGAALLGYTNMDDAGYRRCRNNPFHPEFHDNYASGLGLSIEEALEGMFNEIKNASNSLLDH